MRQRTLLSARVRQRLAALLVLRLRSHLQRPDRHSTALLRLKAKWLAYSQVLFDSLSVRKGADRDGVHRNTAFHRRHRFLQWVKLDRPLGLNSIVEADETFLLESQKGTRTLDRPLRHRGGHASKRRIPVKWTASWSRATARGASPIQ